MASTLGWAYSWGVHMSEKPRSSKLRNLLILGLCLVGTALITQEGGVTGQATGATGGCGGDMQWDEDVLYRDVDDSSYALTEVKTAEDRRRVDVEVTFSSQIDIFEAQTLIKNIEVIMKSRVDPEEPKIEM